MVREKSNLEMAIDDIAGRVKDEEFRKKVEDALKDIKRILGEDSGTKGSILRKGFIYEIVYDGTVAEPGYLNLVRFADMLREFEDDTEFKEEIKPRLQTRGEIFDAYRELEDAYKIREKGIEADFIKRDTTSGRNTPDLLVDSSIEIEIKNLRSPDHFDNQIELRNMLKVPNLGGKPLVAQKIYTGHLSSKRASEISEELSAAKEKAVEDEELVEFSFEGVKKEYEAAVAPESQKEKFKNWKKEHDIEKSSPSYPDVNEHIRIFRKINKASNQFTGKHRSVLLAHTQSLRIDNQTYEEFINRLEREVYDNENLDSVIISVSVPEIDEIPFEEKKNYRIYRQNPRYQPCPTDYIIIHDRYSEERKYQEKIDQIFRPNSPRAPRF